MHLDGISSSKYHLNHLMDKGNGSFFSSSLFAHFGAISLRVMALSVGPTKSDFALIIHIVFLAI